MIIGIGCDLINIQRVARIIINSEYKIFERLYTSSEIKAAPRKTSCKYFSYFAKRFSAKESYAKATSNGISEKVTFRSIEILNTRNGAPYFNKHPLENQNIQAYLSMSDEFPYALSYVTLWQN